MSVKRQIFINNKDIDGKIDSNTIFDFDFNVDKRLGAVLAYGFVYFCDGSCKWMVGV